ncbi:hypothetical protein D918_07736 [Trichuris suis]|nr:hypothetical protein D918_07736 [Trichuris suis]
MNLPSALMIVLALTCSANAIITSLWSCPSESAGHSFLGFRTKNGKCVTAIFRGQILSSKVNSSGTIKERAMNYCKTHFKLGTLVSFQDFKQSATHLETIGLYNSDDNDTWQAALCLHNAYADCFRKGKNKCVYVPEKKGCLWQHTYIEVQAQELPYGRQCQAIAGNGHKCDCSQCSTTEWSPWTNYTHHLGFPFRTRYRPEDTSPCHNCYLDTSLCCAQHEVPPHLNVTSIPCLNGGIIDPWIGDRCKCRKNFTGSFCEIEQGKKQQRSAFGNTAINLTVPQAMALLLIWTAATILACLLCAGSFKSMSPNEKRRSVPNVVVNIQNVGDKDKVVQAGDAENESGDESENTPYGENYQKRATEHGLLAGERHERQVLTGSSFKAFKKR